MSICYILSKFDADRSAEIVSLLNELQKIDPFRKMYYTDFASSLRK